MDISKSLENLIALATGSKDPIALNAVMEVQRQLIVIQEENRNLRQDIHELKNLQIVESELEYCEGVYRKNDAIYCSICWADKKLIRVRYFESDYENYKVFFCDVCNKRLFSNIPDY